MLQPSKYQKSFLERKLGFGVQSCRFSCSEVCLYASADYEYWWPCDIQLLNMYLHTPHIHPYIDMYDIFCAYVGYTFWVADYQAFFMLGATSFRTNIGAVPKAICHPSNASGVFDVYSLLSLRSLEVEREKWYAAETDVSNH